VVNTMDRLVLVVEDEEAIREVITDVLEERGFEVVCTRNGAEALKFLETAMPSVVVLDLLMPVMHGWAFMEEYVERIDGSPIPIVVVSVNPALPRSYERFGVKRILAKPFDLDDLADAVEYAAQTPAA
jgi:CheY-like chemotaxis protein